MELLYDNDDIMFLNVFNNYKDFGLNCIKIYFAHLK